MSKITNDGLTRSGTGCFMAHVPIWQQGKIDINVAWLSVILMLIKDKMDGYAIRNVECIMELVMIIKEIICCSYLLVKMVNGSRYYRALESVSIAPPALSGAFTIYPCQFRVHQTLTVLNSNSLQLGRRSGGQPQRTVYSRQLWCTLR